MTILLRQTVLMKARHRQIKGGRMMQVGRHRMGIMDDTMGHRRRIKGGLTITRRHRHRRRIATETEIEIGIVIAIMTATGITSHITMCTPNRELLLRCRRVKRFWCV
jgi:CTP synthase (UTP-ammonia lyase)